MNKKNIHRIRLGLGLTVLLLSFLAFWGNFYPIKIFDLQIGALSQRLITDISLLVIILSILLVGITLLFGRIYCSTLCPLGIFQELLMLISRKKIAPQKNLPYKYFLAAISFGFLLGGSAFIIRLIDPYTLFGAANSLSWFGLGFIFILTILVFTKGRFFCSNICPVGVFLGLLSKHAANKIYIDKQDCISCGLCAKNCPTGSIDFKNKSVDNETCIKCFNCLGICHKNSLKFGHPQKSSPKFDFQRRDFLIKTAAAGVFLIAIKSGINFAQASGKKIKNFILPAGSNNLKEFQNKCLNCNLCVQNCPMKIIKKANTDCSTVHIEYEDKFCKYNCHKCSQICPSGAIKRLSLAEKQKTQIAFAQIDDEVCVKCGICVQECPRGIIKKEEEDFPKINPEECIGCGACQAVCPVKAISIIPVEQQKILKGE